MTKCIYKKTDVASAEMLNKHRHLSFEGSSVRSLDTVDSNKKASDVAKNEKLSKKRLEQLFKITHYFKPSEILEISTSLVMATISFSLGNPKATIQTVEACAVKSAIASTYFETLKFQNVTVINAKPQDFFISEAFKKSSFGLIYMNGKTDNEQIITYFESLLPHIHNDSVLIFSDIYACKSRTNVWQKIIDHPLVTVSIDSFYCGIVFFRKEQNKEHFILRL